jgi:hypothetical protein
MLNIGTLVEWKGLNYETQVAADNYLTRKLLICSSSSGDINVKLRRILCMGHVMGKIKTK